MNRIVTALMVLTLGACSTVIIDQTSGSTGGGAGGGAGNAGGAGGTGSEGGVVGMASSASGAGGGAGGPPVVYCDIWSGPADGGNKPDAGIGACHPGQVCVYVQADGYWLCQWPGQY
ncbi:MAG TPA: hypothetical protein VHB21_10980 [Minicystis sp.]|nr:hypothetical protein [Minicystis sp.]